MGDLPSVEARGIVKRFPGVLANDSVDFDVRPGEVHALLGENGAGKSTLASILTGLYHPDEGEVRIRGERVHLKSPRDGLAFGIGMVHQHFRLVKRFTVAENVLLGDKRQPLLLSTQRAEEEVAWLAERYSLPLDPRAVVADLSVGEQQRVEIVKTLARGVDVLLLDEPTAVLTPQEVDALFETVRALNADGKAVVFISHKLGEVTSVADRVTVMRDGRVVATIARAETTAAELARLMVGRAVDLSSSRAPRPPADVLLKVSEVSVGGHGARGRLHDVAFDVSAGEIVGVAGVAGNGQKTLAEVIAGLQSPRSGRVTVNGVDVTGKGARATRAAGLAYVPEDRNGVGLAPGLSIAENLLLTRPPRLLVNRRRAVSEAREVIRRFGVKAPGPLSPTRSLSGGNVQKVLLARELGEGPRVLVVSSPTWGLDVGAVEFVRDLLVERRAAGCAILLISEDLDEVRALSDRILVLYEGRIVYECPGENSDVTKLGLAMAGVA